MHMQHAGIVARPAGQFFDQACLAASCRINRQGYKYIAYRLYIYNLMCCCGCREGHVMSPALHLYGCVGQKTTQYLDLGQIQPTSIPVPSSFTPTGEKRESWSGTAYPLRVWYTHSKCRPGYRHDEHTKGDQVYGTQECAACYTSYHVKASSMRFHDVRKCTGMHIHKQQYRRRSRLPGGPTMSSGRPKPRTAAEDLSADCMLAVMHRGPLLLAPAAPLPGMSLLASTMPKRSTLPALL